MSFFEVTGTVTAVAYLLLIAHRKRIAWFFYIVSSLAFIPVFFGAKLYGDTTLQVLFVVMGVLAWRAWSRIAEREVAVVSWATLTHLVITLGLGFLSAVVGQLLWRYTDAGFFAYADGFILVGSIVATYLTVARVVENWWYWLVINLTTVVVYGLKAIWIACGLASIYTILSVYGLWQWRLARVKAR
jgi:nicotinamide mononucleotide transporter